MKSKVKITILFIILLVLGIISIILSFTDSTFLSEMCSGISLIISAYVGYHNWLFEQKFEEYLKISRNKKGDIEEMTIDSGEY